MMVRWFVANISSRRTTRCPLTFTGSPWVYVGWYLLAFVSIITIIGWAWVMTAWMRWMCRNIDGTRREITFNASGWEVLWRTLLFGLGCVPDHSDSVGVRLVCALECVAVALVERTA